MMLISVVIPTFQRPDYLLKALDGLARQKRVPDQVVLGLREGDNATSEFIASLQDNFLPLEIAFVQVPGVIASMNAAIEKTRGDIVCLLDDDAEPTPDWLQKIEQHFEQNPQLGALGGRDLLQDHPEMRRDESVTESVGIVTQYGRIVGNHHRGSGGFRRVNLFKGCNAALRGDLLREVGIEKGLKGQGAQVHWELALCLDVQRRGYFVAYDSAVQIIHHIAPRADDDQIHRGGFSAQGLSDLVFNEHFVIHSRLQGARRYAHLLWSLAVGTLLTPGIVQYLRGKAKRESKMERKWVLTLRATLRGLIEGRKASQKKHNAESHAQASQPSLDI